MSDNKKVSDAELAFLEWDDATQSWVKQPTKIDGSPWWESKPRKCECGIASLGYEVGHSDYCPLYVEVK